MTNVTNPDLLTHLTHDPLSALMVKVKGKGWPYSEGA